MWKATRRTKIKSPDSWNPCTKQIRESSFLWDANSASSLMRNSLLGSMEGIKHISYFIDKLILSRFIDMFKFQVSNGHIARIKEQGAHWHIVSCRSNRRDHLSNSFIAWTKPKVLVHVTASASFIFMTRKQGNSFTIWKHIWHITMEVGYTHTLQLNI
jgi:hypothetical protein